MELVKHNPAKKRSVYKADGLYHKVWHFSDPRWLAEHFETLQSVCPELPRDWHYGDHDMTLIMNTVPGTPASEYPHTEQFVDAVYTACVNNIDNTRPLYHGDWCLSNMIVNDDRIVFIDWDNVNYYPEAMVWEKLHSDLHSAFGELFLKYCDRNKYCYGRS